MQEYMNDNMDNLFRKETDVKSHTSEFYDRYTTVRECLVGLNN